ncbi:hypothetical protein K461DRAFT_81195 [Myriangium duriaei CBS 260.36]|uniref:Uncharacterized protein n=1 Tax=Myriangium duriaei CBS 260.36 TaxID=1168546 RepID=A0A9P4J6I2_9PEZI|nr:hypothetical protein K461DRAFT_81195 [Myriangium duriaei CBS 260.36]
MDDDATALALVQQTMPTTNLSPPACPAVSPPPKLSPQALHPAPSGSWVASQTRSRLRFDRCWQQLPSWDCALVCDDAYVIGRIKLFTLLVCGGVVKLHIPGRVNLDAVLPLPARYCCQVFIVVSHPSSWPPALHGLSVNAPSGHSVL